MNKKFGLFTYIFKELKVVRNIILISVSTIIFIGLF